jgi:hypothetical protein
MPPAQLDEALARLTESGLAFRRGTPPDAVYTFKHALIRDAAYDALLKSRRGELHAKIARVIEARFPNTKTTEPELLAYHLTASNSNSGLAVIFQRFSALLGWVECGTRKASTQGGRTAAAAMDWSRWDQCSKTA